MLPPDPETDSFIKYIIQKYEPKQIVDIEKFEDFHLCGAGDPISMPVAIGLFAKRQRGNYYLRVGNVNAHGISINISPDPQGLCGQPKLKACHWTQESNPYGRLV